MHQMLKVHLPVGTSHQFANSRLFFVPKIQKSITDRYYQTRNDNCGTVRYPLFIFVFASDVTFSEYRFDSILQSLLLVLIFHKVVYNHKGQ